MVISNYGFFDLQRLAMGVGIHAGTIYVQALCQKLGNFILEGKERGDACRGAKNKANVKMRISSTAKSCNLSANLKGM